MARRRGEYRTWDELSPQERRLGLAILGGIGVIAVAAVVLAFGGIGKVGGVSGGGEPLGAAAPPVVSVAAESDDTKANGTEPDGAEPDGPKPDQAALDQWYTAIDGHRHDISGLAGTVRAAIAALDGMALEPACTQLAAAVTTATASASPPASPDADAWAGGLRAYGQAADWCAQIFDEIPDVDPTIPDLHQRIIASLDTADTAWSGLRPTTCL
ncbi:MAG: hypothetical protein IRZ08_21255, partial [Frankia sp.]|nr:hypothetical protein [Frankia sp.]